MTTENPPVEPDEEDDVTIADKPRAPTEYEKRLRRESAKHRTELKATREELASFKASAEADKEAIRVQVRNEADQRVIRAELKAAALKAGMVDLDGLKLLDLSSLKITADGNIEGADALLTAAKVAKPYLFGVASTSSTQKTPDPKAPEAKRAQDMTPEEYAAERKKIR